MGKAKTSLDVGLSLGGKDSGWTKAATGAAESVGLITGAMKGLVERGAKGFGNLKDKISSVVSAFPTNLTTGYEAQLVAADKAGHAQAFTLGYGAKQMAKFSAEATNLGIQLNIGTEAAGKAVFAWDRGKDVLKAVGIDSKETAAKLQDLGLDMGQFVYTLKEMQTSLGMDDKAIKKVTESTLAWGQQSGDVNGAMASLQEQVDHLSKRAHAFGKTLTGGELADWAENTNQAKQAIFTLIPNMKKAGAAADQMSEMALASGKNMGAMFAGVESDLTPFQKQLAVAGVSVGDQFKLMKQGPLGFLKGIAQMAAATGKPYKEMSADQQNFIKRTIESSGLGEEAQQALWTAMNKGPDALKGIIDKLPKATENIGELGKAAHRTGRTTQDWLDLSKGQFIAALRASNDYTVGVGKNAKVIHTGALRDKQFLERTKKSMDAFQKKIQKISADGGPLGMMVDKLKDVQKYGLAGFAPQFAGEIETFKALAETFGPVLMGLGQMVPLLGAILSPMGLLVLAVGGLVYWFMSARKEGDSFSDTVTRMQEQASSFFADLEPWLASKFPKHAKTIHLLVKGLEIGFWAISSVVSKVVEGFGYLFDFIELRLNSSTTLLDDIGEMWTSFWKYEVIEPIKLYFTDLWLDIKAQAAELFGKDVVQVVSDTLAEIGKVLNTVQEPFTAPFRLVAEAIEGILGYALAPLTGPLKAASALLDKFSKSSIDTQTKNTLAAVTQQADKAAASVGALGKQALGTPPPAVKGGSAVAAPGGPAAKSLPPPTRPTPAASADSRDASLVNAVHQPNWYARYEQIFNARMQALERAVAGTGAGGRGGGKAAANPRRGELSTGVGANKLGHNIAGVPSTAK